jgi:hypothetical protein
MAVMAEIKVCRRGVLSYFLYPLLRGLDGSLREPWRPRPGMALVAEIKAGQRGALSHFLYPLLRGLDESLREP